MLFDEVHKVVEVVTRVTEGSMRRGGTSRVAPGSRRCEVRLERAEEEDTVGRRLSNNSRAVTAGTTVAVDTMEEEVAEATNPRATDNPRLLTASDNLPHLKPPTVTALLHLPMVLHHPTSKVVTDRLSKVTNRCRRGCARPVSLRTERRGLVHRPGMVDTEGTEEEEVSNKVVGMAGMAVGDGDE